MFLAIAQLIGMLHSRRQRPQESQAVEMTDRKSGTQHVAPIRKRSLQGAAPQCRNEAILMPPHGKEPPVRTSGPEGVFPGVIKELEVEG